MIFLHHAQNFVFKVNEELTNLKIIWKKRLRILFSYVVHCPNLTLIGLNIVLLNVQKTGPPGL